MIDEGIVMEMRNELCKIALVRILRSRGISKQLQAVRSLGLIGPKAIEAEKQSR
jgi:hypothetical protein